MKLVKSILFLILLLLICVFVLTKLGYINACPAGEVSIGNGECRGTGLIPPK